MKAALLIGNGLNRCYTEQVLSWENLMQDIASKKGVDFRSNNSFPLEFECMANSICSKDNKDLDSVIKELKKDIAEMVRQFSPEQEWIHTDFLKLPVQEIMTTNYDYYLEKILDPDFLTNWHIINEENKYSNHRRYIGTEKTIRHIHGEANKPETICLGYDHYASTLINMKQYLKGEVNLKEELKTKALPLSGNLRPSSKHHYGDSWMELFFTHDVHIVGLSLDVCEIDLWWLLTYRAKLISLDTKKLKTINNKIYFYYTTSTPKKDPCEGCSKKKAATKKGTSNIELFERLHVECVEIPRGDKTYAEGYQMIAQKIGETIAARQ